MTADEMRTQPGEEMQEPLPVGDNGGRDPVSVTPGFYLDREEGQWRLLLECRWQADPDQSDDGFGMAALLTDIVLRVLRGEQLELPWLSPEEGL